MKKLSLLLLFVVFVIITKAQPSTGGIPLSFTFDGLSADFDTRLISEPDIEQYNYLDSMDNRDGNPFRVGVNIPVNLNMKNSGTWASLPDQSGRIWRLRLTSPEAKALSLYYSSFYIPVGASLFLYSENKKQILGAYTSEINPETSHFATEMIQGNSCVLEYFEPAGVTIEAVIEIEELAYIYRGESLLNPEIEQYADSDPCEVDINCSPEGNNWQDEKRGVCRIQIKIGAGTFLCSGSLLNNKRQDCSPYILTADHCAYSGGYATTTNLNQWIFYFNYAATVCNGSSVSGLVTKTGCTLKAHDTYGSNGNGSDFYLVKLNLPVTSNNLYFNGWTRSNPGSSGVGIHHPAGDIMKISTYTSTPTTVNVGFVGSHWRVVWAVTTNGHGVTEQGSSGSPLYNSTGMVVGTLTGGTSCCTTNGCGTGTGPTMPDYYGKFAHHWASNGTTSAKQLKPWLDPDNTNPTSLAGTYTCTPAAIAETKMLNQSVSIYPNPASDKLNIAISGEPLKKVTVQIWSLLGEDIFTQSYSEAGELFTIDVENLPKGMYFLSLESGSARITRKFVIQ